MTSGRRLIKFLYSYKNMSSADREFDQANDPGKSFTQRRKEYREKRMLNGLQLTRHSPLATRHSLLFFASLRHFFASLRETPRFRVFA